LSFSVNLKRNLPPLIHPVLKSLIQTCQLFNLLLLRPQHVSFPSLRDKLLNFTSLLLLLVKSPHQLLGHSQRLLLRKKKSQHRRSSRRLNLRVLTLPAPHPVVC